MEEDLTLIDYVNTYHKHVADEYVAYLNRWNRPKVGDKVVTLRSGFGGGAGVIRVVAEIEDKYIRIKGGVHDHEYLSLISEWYKDLKVIK